MKILCWNMGAGFGFRGAKHAAAWDWLNSQDADVAILQEVVPRKEFITEWRSVIFTQKWQNWGCGVLVRAGGYEKVVPGADQPWLSLLGGAAVVAKPQGDHGPWFASIHSDASSVDATHKRYPGVYATQPSRDAIPRSSTKEMWEIEAIAHELQPILAGKRFIVGGDLNSSLLMDRPGHYTESKIFENLASLGYLDIRHRHSTHEIQTFFKSNTRPFMLDHLYADAATEASVSSWRVVTEVAADLGLSDHAPIEFTLSQAD